MPCLLTAETFLVFPKITRQSQASSALTLTASRHPRLLSDLQSLFPSIFAASTIP